MIRTTLISAATAATLAASMASPASALSNNGKFWLGVGLASTAIAVTAAHRHKHRYNYCANVADNCSDYYIPGTWKFDKCMRRNGC